MQVTLLSKTLLNITLTLLMWASQAHAQNLLSCKNMTWQNSLETKDISYFIESQNLSQLRDSVKVAFQVIDEFQRGRAQEIRTETQDLMADANALKTFMVSYSTAQRDLRISMAIGYQPYLSDEFLNSNFRYFLNTEMDMSYFRALPNKRVQPLSEEEIQKGMSIMQEFFTLEMNLFESLLTRKNMGLASNHPLVRLQKELRSAKNIGEKLLNPNRTLQSYMIDKLREFRAQQRELSLMTILRLAPLAYTVTKRHPSTQDYQKAVDLIILNGTEEVQRLEDDLNMWLSDQEFSRFSMQVQTRRTLNHKRVTVANALMHLKSIFDYIPAIEEALLQNPSACEVMERALAIHFKRLSNQQIGNMVLFIAALAVAPMITGPVLMTTAVVGGKAFSFYSIQQESNNYQRLVRSTLTEVSAHDVDPQIYEELRAIEADIVTQQIFLPTLLPAMGFGLKSVMSTVRLKSLL